MRAYELHGVNDLRREDIEKPEIPSGWVHKALAKLQGIFPWY